MKERIFLEEAAKFYLQENEYGISTQLDLLINSVRMDEFRLSKDIGAAETYASYSPEAVLELIEMLKDSLLSVYNAGLKEGLEYSYLEEI